MLPSSSKRTFVVIAQYLGHTDPASGTAFSNRQRLSLVWRATPDGLRLFHYHVSNPLKATIGAEPFPTSFAKETYRYAMALSQQHGLRLLFVLLLRLGRQHQLHGVDAVAIHLHHR